MCPSKLILPITVDTYHIMLTTFFILYSPYTTYIGLCHNNNCRSHRTSTFHRSHRPSRACNQEGRPSCCCHCRSYSWHYCDNCHCCTCDLLCSEQEEKKVNKTAYYNLCDLHRLASFASGLHKLGTMYIYNNISSFF